MKNRFSSVYKSYNRFGVIVASGQKKIESLLLRQWNIERKKQCNRDGSDEQENSRKLWTYVGNGNGDSGEIKC